MKRHFEVRTQKGQLLIQMEGKLGIEVTLLDSKTKQAILKSTYTELGGSLDTFSDIRSEVEKWFITITHDLYEALPYIHRFQRDKEHVLEFCLFGGIYAVELLKSCPALAYYLTFGDVPRSPEKKERVFRKIATKKRVEILADRNFYAARWIVKLFEKIPPEECTFMTFRYLSIIISRHQINDTFLSEHSCSDLSDEKIFLEKVKDSRSIKTLRHLPRINFLVMKLMSMQQVNDILDSSFYHDACMQVYKDTEEIVDSIKELKRLRSTSDVELHLNVRSLADISRYHDLFVEGLQRVSLKNIPLQYRNFPPPPVQELKFYEDGSEWGIFPIRNAQELAEEGKEMHHCILSYARMISCPMPGLQEYAYHVQFPGEGPATLLIKEIGNGRYRIQEIRGIRNAAVPSRVQKRVKKWLRTAVK